MIFNDFVKDFENLTSKQLISPEKKREDFECPEDVHLIGTLSTDLKKFFTLTKRYEQELKQAKNQEARKQWQQKKQLMDLAFKLEFDKCFGCRNRPAGSHLCLINYWQVVAVVSRY